VLGGNGGGVQWRGGGAEQLVAGFAIPANFSRSLKPFSPPRTAAAAAVSPRRPRGPRQERAEAAPLRAGGAARGSGTTTVRDGVVVPQCEGVSCTTYYNIMYFITYYIGVHD